MLNPLRQESHARLATEMVEWASQLPPGHRVALVLADGCTICFGHEKSSPAQTIVLLLQRRLCAKGIEPTAFAFSPNGLRWALVGVMPPPGCKARMLEAELEQLLRDFRPKARRRRGRAGKVLARRQRHGHGNAEATA